MNISEFHDKLNDKENRVCIFLLPNKVAYFRIKRQYEGVPLSTIFDVYDSPSKKKIEQYSYCVQLASRISESKCCYDVKIMWFNKYSFTMGCKIILDGYFRLLVFTRKKIYLL